MHYEAEARAILDSIRPPAKEYTKEEYRLLLETKKLENIQASYAALKRQERRALHLLRLPDYQNIKPTLKWCAQKDRPLWLYYRHIISAAPYQGRIGRQICLFCIDQQTGGILGIVEINSDMADLAPRDRLLSWSKAKKFRFDGLGKIASCGTCVSAAPFGRLTGGKFQIVAILSKEIQEVWANKYKSGFAAVCTTSLFGKSSIYNRIKEFQYLGCTSGNSPIVGLTDENAKNLKAFVKINNIQLGRGGTHHSGRLELLEGTCRALKYDFSKLYMNAPKGVYLGYVYENSRDILSSVPDQIEPIGDLRSISEISDWWMDRWYAMRWPKMRAEIEQFDWSFYKLDNQIDRIQRAKQAMTGTTSTAAGQH
jgi:hypothetical protein